MAQNDTWPPVWRDLMAGFGLLTRLPVRISGTAGANAAWTWPLVGASVAMIAGAAGLLALWLDLPAGIAGGVVLGMQVMLTGAMHEDGLADSADGLWGGIDTARRLEIMKDSRIGSYGVLALVLVVGMRWQAVAVLIAVTGSFWSLIAAAALSRAAMAAVMATVPPARSNGLARAVGQPEPFIAVAGCGLALGLAVLAVGWAALPAALAAGLAAVAVARLAKARIGGQTGDILGLVQQVSELAVLLVLVAAL